MSMLSGAMSAQYPSVASESSLLAERAIPFALMQSLVAVAKKLTFLASVATSPQPKQPRFVSLTLGLE